MGALRVCAVAAPEKLRLAYEKTFPLPGNYSVQVLLHSNRIFAMDSCLVGVSGHFSSWEWSPSACARDSAVPSYRSLYTRASLTLAVCWSL